MKFLKVIGLVIAVVVLAVGAFYARALWCTREVALPGQYIAEGAWGTSTLDLRQDHTFRQKVSFKNQFNEKPEGSKEASGQWSDEGRSSLSRRFQLSSFVNLSPSAEQSVVQNYEAEYKTLGTSFGIEVDPGARIYYWKMK